MSLTPGSGISHMPPGNEACGPQLLNLCPRAGEPQLLKPVCLEPALCTQRSHRNEKPHTAMKSSPGSQRLSKNPGSNEDPGHPKIHNYVLKKISKVNLKVIIQMFSSSWIEPCPSFSSQVNLFLQAFFNYPIQTKASLSLNPDFNSNLKSQAKLPSSLYLTYPFTSWNF